MRPQAGVGKLKQAPPLQANDLPLVAQAVSPANDTFSRLSRERLPETCSPTSVKHPAVWICGRAIARLARIRECASCPTGSQPSQIPHPLKHPAPAAG